MTLRRATIADAGPLSALAARTFLEAYASTNRPAHVEAYAREAFAPDAVWRLLDDPGRLTVVAERDGSLVGYAALRLGSPVDCVDDPAPAELTRLYVDGREQGRGTGGLLVRAAIEATRVAGHRHLWLAVWEENRRAERFYERHGFIRAGQTTFRMGPEVQRDHVMLRKCAQ